MAMRTLAVKRARSTGAEPDAAPGEGGGTMFGKGYVVIVVAEVVLLFGGIAVLGALDRPQETNVAWIALVVGVHFVALGPVWKNRSIMLPGAVLTVLGLAGLAVTSTSALPWVPFFGGVLSGVTLLAGSLSAARYAQAAQAARAASG
ncbi:hypothetical protein GCM10010466_33260 [Planomonospora alba]|uniref:Integral membrane protein n=1 Tax=Planomonospora alba TaxID=161354 RepID=A0ABP6N857_9ACTN